MYKAIKSLGQNFLKDTESVNKMILALGIKKQDLIIEIGPGPGVLTEEISKQAIKTSSRFLAVELDKRFSEKLKKQFNENNNIEIVQANILDFLPTFNPQRDFKIIGSLPYYITSPILHKIIKMEKQPDMCVLLVQKEVAEKIAATKPDSSYLSSFVQTFFDVEYLFTIENTKFDPVPKVDGGVLLLKNKGLECSPKFIKKFEGFLHRCYANPRKMLNKVFSKEEFEKIYIDPKLRPQNLNAEEWKNIYTTLVNENKCCNTSSK